METGRSGFLMPLEIRAEQAIKMNRAGREEGGSKRNWGERGGLLFPCRRFQKREKVELALRGEEGGTNTGAKEQEMGE